ncbi:MAG: protein kinase [Pyrinomonadaceae bacterium]
MPDESWQRVREIFDSALRVKPEERRKFISKACGDDDALLNEVDTLLASHESSESFMETPAIAEMAYAIEGTGKKLENGSRLGHYEIIEQIGTGGMGEVYLARDQMLDRQVAVKILNEKFSNDESNLSRFIREAQTASALNHPNILVIHEIGACEDAQFIVSEFIEGKTLRQILKEEELNLPEVLDVAIQIANALSAAHEAHLIHRDIKPENIMIRPDGFVKVLDFGLAKLVEQKARSSLGLDDCTAVKNISTEGMILGTVNYMSPEQAKGESVDERTDIFSLGVVIYEMIAGHMAFDGESTWETIANLINDEPQPLSSFAVNLPDELPRIVSKMLDKKKDGRYQTAKDLLIDLKNASEDLEFHDKVLIIAVMPFVNESGNADVEYLSDGITETLIRSLSQLPNLNVKAQSSVFRYKGKTADAQTIGKELNVQAILNGRVVQHSDQLTLTLELVDARSENVIWSEQYDREQTDLISLQSEIALDVSQKLKIKLSGADEAKVTKKSTENAEAYKHYLQGRFHWNKRTAENMRKAIGQFKAAVEKDPNYALAYIGLADCYAISQEYLRTPSSEALPQAKAYANRALEIDDSLGEAHTTLGLINRSLWNWAEAEKEFKRAIELNPNYPTAHHWYCRFLRAMGRTDEALAEIKLANELDPLSPVILGNLVHVYLELGEVDAAFEQCRKAIELHPNSPGLHNSLSYVYLKQGRTAEALAEAQKAVELSNRANGHLSLLGNVYAKSGNRNEALAIVKELEENYLKRQADGIDIAGIYAGLGNKDQAFEWIEKQFQNHSSELMAVKTEPVFEPLRSDPRYRDLLRQMNLPE